MYIVKWIFLTRLLNSTEHITSQSPAENVVQANFPELVKWKKNLSLYISLTVQSVTNRSGFQKYQKRCSLIYTSVTPKIYPEFQRIFFPYRYWWFAAKPRQRGAKGREKNVSGALSNRNHGFLVYWERTSGARVPKILNSYNILINFNSIDKTFSEINLSANWY